MGEEGVEQCTEDSLCLQELQPAEQGQVPHPRSAQGREPQNRERDEPGGAQEVPRQEGRRVTNQGDRGSMRSGLGRPGGGSFVVGTVAALRQDL